jgi:hypothetical protein
MLLSYPPTCHNGIFVGRTKPSFSCKPANGFWKMVAGIFPAAADTVWPDPNSCRMTPRRRCRGGGGIFNRFTWSQAQFDVVALVFQEERKIFIVDSGVALMRSTEVSYNHPLLCLVLSSKPPHYNYSLAAFLAGQCVSSEPFLSESSINLATKPYKLRDYQFDITQSGDPNPS